MAIDRISFPASTPTAVADYQAQNALITAAFSESANVVPFVGSAMTTGYVFQVGGTVYKVNGTVTISGGTATPYVKITPSGATAAASFVSSLTGVSWSTVYNGYYDGSGNRYLFDESTAIAGGVITYANRKTSQWGVGISQTGGFAGGSNATVTNGGSIGTDATATIGGAVGGGATATSGGAIGGGSSATNGGAVGFDSSETNGGGAVGVSSRATYGGAVGNGADAATGGAIGASAAADSGGAVGNGAQAGTGGAVGFGTSAINGFSGGEGAVSGNDQFSLLNKVKYGYFASSVQENEVFTFINTVMTTNVSYPVMGAFGSAVITALQKISSTQIRITYGSGSTKDFTSGTTTAIGSVVSIMVMKTQ